MTKARSRGLRLLAALLVALVFAVAGIAPRTTAAAVGAGGNGTTSASIKHAVPASQTPAAAQPVDIAHTRPSTEDLISAGTPLGGSNAETSPSSVAHHTLPRILLALFLMLTLAKIGGDLFERIGQPAVLGELMFGILLGNLGLLKLDMLEPFVQHVIRDSQVQVFITILAELGVILLLFEVGLESTVHEMMSVGVTATLVAVIGVIVPMALGYGLGAVFLPHEPYTVHLFIAAVLAATSVGITARVLKDLGKMQLRESKIILGAAVIDDILGLVVLAVVQGIAQAALTGQSMSIGAVLAIIAKAGAFFLAAILVGMLISKRLYRVATYLQGQGVLITLTLGWCFLIAYLGTLVGVAPIVGAFAAGLVLEAATFADWRGREAEIEDLIRPLTAFLVPVFFVHTGMGVDLRVLANTSILGFAALLTTAAILGKQACALVVREPGLNRMAVGIGMVPRGEVGLIIATIGASMRTPKGHPLVSGPTYSAVVLVVLLTTVVTPPALKWSLARPAQQPRDAAPDVAPSQSE